MLGCHPSTLTQRSMHHQKSSSDSPFQAKTGNPGTERETGAKSRGDGLSTNRAPHTVRSWLQSHFFQHLPSRRSFRDTLKTHKEGSREESALAFLISSSPPRKSSVHQMRGNTVSKITFICKIELLLQVRWPAFLLGTLATNLPTCILTQEQFVDLAVMG